MGHTAANIAREPQSSNALHRRDFAKSIGAFVVAFALPQVRPLAQPAPVLPRSFQTMPRLDGWIRIQQDGSVVVFTGKAELGQGILTALAQIAAEELDVAFQRIRMVAADTSRGPDEAYTYGSQSVEQSGAALRVAGAEARAYLKEAAARQLGVPAADLRVRDGTIAAADGRQVSYWDLAGQGLARLDVPVTTRATPKRPSEYAVVGKSIPRPDLWAKVRGEAFFLQDMRPPGMLHGRVVMPETYGATLLEVDVVAAKNMPGVIAVVRDASFLGVVAEREEQAIAARAQLLTSARWSAAPVKLPMGSPLAEQLKTWKSEDTVIDAAGQDTPAPQATLQHQASYSRPYLSHASVGPSCALAHMHEGRMTVWSHTQGAYPLRGDLATVLGLPADKVDVVHVPGSGCYGHNGADDVALDAALLARAVDGRPVRVQWMRADEFACSPLGPAMAITIKAALDAEGKLVDWDYEVWSNSHAMRPGQPGGINLLAAQRKSRPAVPSQPLRIPQPFGDGDRNAVTLYRVPRRKTTNHLLLQAPIRNSSLRTLGGHGNMFAIECFMDELAALSGQDPIAFRKAHLSDPRALAVIDAVAQRAAWQPGFKSAAGKGRGFAYARYKNVQTYAAVVADIAVDKTSGLIRVEKIFAAIDVGRAINPDGVKSQIEGGILQAISWTLKEQVGFDAERITSRDWGSYPVMRCSEMPVVEMILIDRPEEQPLGAGEGALGPASAAVANALANAGVRLRDLPLSAERVRGAMNQ